MLVTAAAQAFHGTGFLSNNSGDVLNALGKGVFGSPLNKLLIIAVLTSASASTQTTILPTARTTLSMAKWNAIPAAFGRVHPRFLTPTFSTLLMGGLSILWTIALLAFNPNQDVLGDTISALGFAVCFYYGFTGVACAFYFRHASAQERAQLPVRRADPAGRWADVVRDRLQGLRLLQHRG